SLVGDAEKFLLHRKDAIQSALAKLLVRKRVKHINELTALYQVPNVSKPRYVRVNTLKMDVQSALLELEKRYMVQKDDLVRDLLTLPPGTDLHNHPLVINGSVFMQGKASSMVAVALGPKPGWQVLDACSAPGNKTIHLAALMRGRGKIIACELNQERVKSLEDTIKLAGAYNVEVVHEDFLNLNPKDPSYSKVHAILLDPSCSGSGTVANRLDHLLPSYSAGHADGVAIRRLTKLAAFQKKALEHALSWGWIVCGEGGCLFYSLLIATRKSMKNREWNRLGSFSCVLKGVCISWLRKAIEEAVSWKGRGFSFKNTGMQVFV
ncbi:unnamed protein product, partial [Ilex paraguariensis]